MLQKCFQISFIGLLLAGMIVFPLNASAVIRTPALTMHAPDLSLIKATPSDSTKRVGDTTRNVVAKPKLRMMALSATASGTGSISVTAATNNSDVTSFVQNVLVTGCLKASNVTFTGNLKQLGHFLKSNSNFDFSEGLILSTGYATAAVGPNNSQSTTGHMNQGVINPPWETDLETIAAGAHSYDPAVLEFDFVPAGNTVQFRYVFASEEYPEYSCSQYNDVFGFFLSGPGISGTYSKGAINIATLPDRTPVSINKIHPQYSWGCSASNSSYYVDNTNGTAIQFDGRTTVLTATYNVQACQTYHIKLAIADVSDDQYDSGVFLEAKSFQSTDVTMQNILGDVSSDKDVMYRGCTKSFIRFSRNSSTSTSDALTIPVNLTGDAVNGTDYKATDSSGNIIGLFPTQVVIPAGQEYTDVYYEALVTALGGTKTITLKVATGCPCDPTVNYITKNITILDVPKVNSTVTANLSCNGGTPVAYVSVKLADGLNPDNYLYGIDGGAYQSSPVFQQSYAVGSNHVVIVADKFYCNSTTSSNITIPASTTIKANAGQNLSMCEGMSGTQLSGGGGIVYSWTSSPAIAVNYLSSTSVSNPSVLPTALAGYYTYTLTVSDPNNTCSNSASMNLTVNPSPKVTVTAVPSGEICSGTPIQLNTTVTNSTSSQYSWNPADELNNSTIANPILTPVSNTFAARSLTVTVTSSNGCATSAQIPDLAVDPLPVISLTATDPSCYNKTDGKIVSTVDGGTPSRISPFYQYLWSTSAITSDVSNLGSGTYSLTVTDSKGCKAMLPATLKNPSPMTTNPVSPE